MRQEIRVAFRTLLRRPLLTGAIVVTVGTAIAATTVAYAVVDSVLLEALPFAEPDRLVAMWEVSGRAPTRRNVVSPANVIAWREELGMVDRVAAMAELSARETSGDEPEQIGVMLASPDYFAAVGGRPVLGRLYGPGDDQPAAAPVAVLSEQYWRRRFGGDPGVIGRTLTINGNPTEVIGVLDDRFDFRPRFGISKVGGRDVWMPHRWPATARQADGRYLQVIGHLAPGATVAQAEQEAKALADRLAESFPERQQGWSVQVLPLKTEVVGDVRGLLAMVFGAVAFVLVIACANVANLLLTRAAERRREMAVRAALGAGRGRLFRQLLIESGLLSLAGGLGGLALAVWGVGLVRRALPDLPRIGAVGIDGSVIGFVALATVGTALLFGLTPALQLPNGRQAGRLSDRSGTGDRRVRWTRAGLVGAQVALSFMLLVGAGLLLRSLVNRLDADLGIDPGEVTTGEVALRGTDRTAEQRAAFFEQAVERVAALPGVTGATAGSIVPMSGAGQGQSFWLLDRPMPRPADRPSAHVRWVHHAYHEVMGIRLLEGRFLAGSDRADAPTAVLINASGAAELWPGESAVGKRIGMEWYGTLDAEVVGVVGDVRLAGPDDVSPGITLYWDHRQAGDPSNMTLIVRGPSSAEAFAPSLRAAIRELDATIPVYNVRSMDELFGATIARARFTTVALAVFAGLALALAALGLYAVMANLTAQREREIGVRMALGADRRSVRWLVTRQALFTSIPALGVGALGAIGLGRLLGSLVFGVDPWDPLTFALAGLAVSGAALLAAWVPARRATRIDPVVAMREQ
ncbi:MAG: ABC transporter permease [Gemmatimonadales bacterium]